MQFIAILLALLLVPASAIGALVWWLFHPAWWVLVLAALAGAVIGAAFIWFAILRNLTIA